MQHYARAELYSTQFLLLVLMISKCAWNICSQEKSSRANQRRQGRTGEPPAENCVARNRKQNLLVAPVDCGARGSRLIALVRVQTLHIMGRITTLERFTVRT